MSAAMERVSGIRFRVMAKLPFFGHLMSKLEVVITDKVPIAAVTPGRKILLNPEWVMSTTDEELAATIVHEVLHAALLVWKRQGTRKVVVTAGGGPVTLWNVAHDYAINLLIRDFPDPERLLLDPALWKPKGLINDRFVKMSAEENYDLLLSELSEKDAKKGPGAPGQGNPQGGQAPGWVKDIQESHGDVKPDDGKAQDAAEKAAEEQFWKVAVVEAAQVHEQRKGKGTLPGQLQKIIDELLDPRVPWADVLSRWVGQNGQRCDFTYRRPSRRSEACGEFLPSMKRSGVADVVVLWDTSGSMDGREVTIMSEVIGIVDELGLSLRIICCDTEITSDVSDVEEPEDVLWAGGGGSDFRPAFARLDEEAFDGVVVAFTDGWIDVPQEKPVDLKGCLWVIWEGDADPTGGRWGEVLYVDKDGYAK